MRFYVYLLFCPNGWFYIGKGQNRRINLSIKKHKAFAQKILFRTDSQEEAFDVEVKQIAAYRAAGYLLLNITDGGEGSAGSGMTEEQWENLRRAAALRSKDMWARRSPERRAEIVKKISQAHKGRPLTEEHKKKLSKAKQRIPKEKRKEISAAGGRSLWDNMTEEEKKEFCQRRAQTQASKRTPEKLEIAKRKRSESMKRAHANRSEEQKEEIQSKIKKAKEAKRQERIAMQCARQLK